MIFSLYNKNTPIADIEFNIQRGYISSIKKIYNPEYLPLGIVDGKKTVDPEKLSDWWEERSIPDTRKNVEKILEHIQKGKHELIIQSLGLSLSDQYWIKPPGSGIEWKEVNFFTNNFPEEIGELFFYQKGIHKSSKLHYSSPDLTANGFLDKRWVIENKGRYLYKKGYDTFRQQPFNEKIASDILKKVGCQDFVTYELGGAAEEEPYCMCRGFVTENTEYIPAALFRKVALKREGESEHAYFMRCCEKLGVKKLMEKYLDYVLPFDYLIGNVDRNYGNFGVIRNVETLKVEKAAPIFDNGNSLWYNEALITQKLKAYPFVFAQEEQIKLIKDPGRFPVKKLKGLFETCLKTLQYNMRCPTQRSEDIAKALDERKHMLVKRLERSHTRD